MDSLIQNIRQANAKALLLSRINIFFIILNSAMLLVLIVTWSVSIAKEGTGVTSRYACCILFFIFTAAATLLSAFVHRIQPKLLIFYLHEVISILALILGSASMGTASLVVDICRDETKAPNISCGSHVIELLAELILCISLGFNYASTQQRIVTYIDNGILDGIKGRSPGVAQLP